MEIVVVGTGYVGLVTSACLAESGNRVVGVDMDRAKIARLREGQVPIHEPELDGLISRNLAQGRLVFDVELEPHLPRADVVFVTVGTPSQADGAVDLTYVDQVAEQVARGSAAAPRTGTGKLLLVIKSTVPPGTTRRIADRLAANGIDVASNPEFLREGVAVRDFQVPDRVIVGTLDPAAEEKLRNLYQPFLSPDRPFLAMTPESAEMTKYVANAFLATKVSFINEMANLCERVGADINEVRQGIGHDARIGFPFLVPGPGWGGSCFPKDTQALLAVARTMDCPAAIVEAAYQANARQKRVLAEKIRSHFGDSLRGRTLAVWGLAFKPETDDIRESPALDLLADMLGEGVHLRAFDPVAMDNVRSRFPEGIEYCPDAYAALEGADALAIVTDWDEFKRADLTEIATRLRNPLVFDGRNLFDPDQAGRAGITYYPVGRRQPKS